MFDALKKLLGVGDTPQQPQHQIASPQDLRGVRPFATQHPRLRYPSGDQEITTGTPKYPDITRGMNFGGRNYQDRRTPVDMPQFFTPGTAFEVHEDGTKSYLSPPIDRMIVEPRRSRNALRGGFI